MGRLRVAAALRWTRRLEGRLPADVTILREPLTAEGLRAGVRPLLPLSSGGTTLAWPAAVERPGAEAQDEAPAVPTRDEPPQR